MSEDINRALERLSRQPVPPALAQIETTVLDRVAQMGPRFRGIPPRYFAGIATVALMMGIVGGVLPRQNAVADSTLYPLAPAARLAPSSLLVE